MAISTISLGKVKFNWRGDWTSSTSYVKDDVVKYGPNVYTCITAHSSQANFADNINDWDLMVAGLENAGVWNTSTLYKVGQTVTYGGAVYIALQESTNLNPYINTAYWQKFVDGQQFEGDWDSAGTYQKGDIVKYGGYLYVAKQNTVSFNPTNITYWDVYSKGFNDEGPYNQATQYKPGDVVAYGGNKYLVIEGQRPLGITPTSPASWSLLTSGFKWRGDWQELSLYFINEVVRYGGNIYLATSDAGTDNPATSLNYSLLVSGTDFKGSHDVGVSYKPGDLVIYGGNVYLATANIQEDDSTDVTPDISDLWTLYSPGMSWQGTWDTNTEYKINEVVEYAQSSYISLTNYNAGNTPSDGAPHWNLVAQGDSNAVLTTQGDIIFRDATQTTRLGIGPAGSVLTSNGSEPVWGHQAPQNDYYVSPQGDDTNNGRTPTTSWRTIKHAAEQTFSLGQVRINVSAGVYEEQCPIRVGRSVVLEGNGLGAVTISPNNDRDEGFGVGISDDGSTPNANSYVFHMNNGARMRNFVFRGFSTGSVLVSLDPGTGPDDTSVWITSQSPYVQNCTSFTPGGTGFKIDGGLHNGGYRSMVANDWTQINSDGIGIHVLNDGRSEIVSCFTYYCNIGYLAESGGKIRAIVGNNSYGEYGAVARGFSQLETPLTGDLQLADETINSVESIGSDVHVFTSYRDSVGNRFYVGHTNPTGTDVTSTFDNTASYPFIAKYNAAGSIDWIYTYESAFGAIHNAVELSDRIYCGGVIYDATNKGFILSISKAGEIQWQKTIGNTTEIVDVTTDGNNLYAIGNHATTGAVAMKLNPAGIEQWSTILQNDGTGSPNTTKVKSCCFAGTPTTSVDTYALAGDATAENNLYVATYDSNANQSTITRLTALGAYVTSYNYGDVNINHLRLDTGNGDGIYLAAAGSYDPDGVGSLTKRPLLFRLTVDGTVQWQNQLVPVTTENGEFRDVLPFGDAVYAVGWFNESNNTNNTGLLARFESNGDLNWIAKLDNGSNNIAFNGVALDGVNVISAGIEEGDSVIFNIQRDYNFGLGTVSNGSYAFTASPGYAVTNTTIVSKTEVSIDNSSVTLGDTDTNLSLNQQPTQSTTVNATRDGFAGIGTGVLFSVSNLSRRPKEGSVLQIDGDDETYFVIGVDNFIENFGVLSDNNPNAVASLTNNRTWIQNETIGWINDQVANATGGSIWDSFTYDQTKCERDVGLIVDALITDLDSSTLGSFEQNDASVDAALSYWSGVYSQVAGQEDQTIAAINYMKGLVGNAMDKSAPAQTYSGSVQDTSHSAVEAGSQTFAEDRVDIITDVIANGPSVVPTVVASGTCQIQIDPAIPSNKTPNDNTALTFREAFSQVRMSGHDFLDIGTGGFADTNYPVIIASDYVQQPNQDRETLAESGGRVFYVTTDQDGNFRVGDYFKVEQATGRATLSSEEFDLAGLNELQLGSITAGKQGATINEFSTDGTFADNSDTSVPTEKAVKTYVDFEIQQATANQGTIQVGDAPSQSKVEVIGDGLATDVVNIEIAGDLRHQFADQYLLVPKGTTAERPGTPVAGYVRYNTDTNALEIYQGSAWVPAGGLSNQTIASADSPYNASAFEFIWIDSTAGSVQVNLPASAQIGDEIRVLDVVGQFSTNNLTINRNGHNIQGLAEDLTVSTDRAGFSLVYYNATQGWLIKDR
jgi:hypothetical protein